MATNGGRGELDLWGQENDTVTFLEKLEYLIALRDAIDLAKLGKIDKFKRALDRIMRKWL